MDFKTLNANKGLLFQDLALVELAINRLISLEYIGSHDQKFISEFLQEPRFSFELRKRIFKRIFQRRYPEIKFPWHELDELQRIRNIVAHARVDEEVRKLNGEVIEVIRKPFYAYHTETMDAENLHEEFQTNLHPIMETLNKIVSDTKIKFTREEPIT